MHHLYNSAVRDGCVNPTIWTGPCRPLLSPFYVGWPLSYGDELGLLLPLFAIAVGMFLGAPLLAREYTSGTTRFAWTQGTGRARLTVTKVVLLGLAVMAVAALLGWLGQWSMQPDHRPVRRGVRPLAAGPVHHHAGDRGGRGRTGLRGRRAGQRGDPARGTGHGRDRGGHHRGGRALLPPPAPLAAQRGAAPGPRPGHGRRPERRFRAATCSTCTRPRAAAGSTRAGTPARAGTG